MTLDISAIRQRIEKATPGKWRWLNGNSWWRLGAESNCQREILVLSPEKMADGWLTIDAADADREFIANAPADMRILLGEIDRLVADNRMLRERP